MAAPAGTTDKGTAKEMELSWSHVQHRRNGTDERWMVAVIRQQQQQRRSMRSSVQRQQASE